MGENRCFELLRVGINVDSACLKKLDEFPRGFDVSCVDGWFALADEPSGEFETKGDGCVKVSTVRCHVFKS